MPPWSSSSPNVSRPPRRSASSRPRTTCPREIPAVRRRRSPGCRRLAAEAHLDPAFAEKFLNFIIGEVIRHHEADRRGPPGRRPGLRLARTPPATLTPAWPDQLYPFPARSPRRASASGPARTRSRPPASSAVNSAARTCPFLAELPDRGVGSDALGRTASLLVELAVDVQPHGWRLVDRPGKDLQRAKSALSTDINILADVIGAEETPADRHQDPAARTAEPRRRPAPPQRGTGPD